MLPAPTKAWKRSGRISTSPATTCSLAERLLVVGNAGAVGGPHFAQPGAGLAHHIGNPERTSDLDKFAARNDHLSPLGQGIERQHRPETCLAVEHLPGPEPEQGQRGYGMKGGH